MSSLRFVIMRWVGLFIIIVGVVGLFSSVWNVAQEYIFQPSGDMVQSSTCITYEDLHDEDSITTRTEEVPSFEVEKDGIRYSCVDNAFPNRMPLYPDSLRWQVPGIFTFSLIIGFGAVMFRYAPKQFK